MSERLGDPFEETSLPPGFREGHDFSLACPHRDLSVCPDCAATHEEVTEVIGAHYWVSDPREREELRQQQEGFER